MTESKTAKRSIRVQKLMRTLEFGGGQTMHQVVDRLKRKRGKKAKRLCEMRKRILNV
jgi:hypothetical protein